jgi:hypothetical protein
MKKRVLPFFGLMMSIAFVSCTQDNGPSGALNGAYAGTYLATGPMADTGDVRIVFVGQNFSGDAEGTKRSICNGNYSIVADSIQFINGCSTPDADLLLAGKYRMVAVGDSLYFSRVSNGIIYYEELFSLKKQ